MSTASSMTVLKAADVTSYLAGRGWTTSADRSWSGAVVWTHSTGCEVALPVHDDQPAAGDAIIEAIEAVSAVEDRSAEAVSDAIASGHRRYHGQVITTWDRQKLRPVEWGQPMAPADVRHLVETTVAGIDAHRIEEYLTERGWTPAHTWPDGRQMWLHEHPSIESILIPQGQRYDEDNAALADVVYRIAFAEDRSVREVLREAAGFHPAAVLVAAEPEPEPEPESAVVVSIAAAKAA